MIDREKLKEAVKWLKVVKTYSEDDYPETQTLFDLAQLVLDGKLVEPLTREELIRIMDRYFDRQPKAQLPDHVCIKKTDILNLTDAILKGKGMK